ncbi:alpha beta-hydrolase [Coniophora puteana RWD-64-598 SS2]|uniref:Alpha beta-hydrolase n=1 Tax=Coniophora puteana (strain RWD-64-598) TaxID=741705 RepID=A0A5M3M7W5_CONPW|nr:alpha beta-hydrolase [Coniophora puteana RWD-64-598 SS2]EIW75006.1 alpha beta-hydrolase [Coniophora puteana RWD-64-598 SS2]
MNQASIPSKIPFTPTSTYESFKPQPWLPIEEYPDPLLYPELPSKPRSPNFSENYTLSTHIVPAAYPRFTPETPLPEIHPFTGNSTERMTQISELAENILRKRYAHDERELVGERDQKIYWHCINRYARKEPSGTGITLFLAHASGFPKETWEATLRTLSASAAGPLIEEIWAWEAIQHGDSALLNARTLGGMYDWADNARDIVNFLLNYMPDELCASLPTGLPRVPAAVSKAREKRGFLKRTLVAVGHSFGGATSALAALNFPNLFSSLILVDPMITPPAKPDVLSQTPSLLSSISRRDKWSSREEAKSMFQKSPFFSRWHPDILDLYVAFGLADDPAGGVRLKTSGLQEALVYANSRRRVPGEVWQDIEKLDPRITLRWAGPGETGLGISVPGSFAVLAWRRPVNASNILIEGAGHLVVQEQPVKLADEIATFLLHEYGSGGSMFKSLL